MFEGTEAREETVLIRPTWVRVPPRTWDANRGIRGEVAPPAILLGRKE